MGNKITYGLEQVHIAFFSSLATGGYEAPIPIPGAVNLTPSPEGSSSTFYADNSDYFIVTSNNGYKADLEVALFPDIVLARILGWEIDDNGMLVEFADSTPEKFALLGQVLGDEKNRRFVYYNCVAERPSDSHATKTETIDPATKTLPITITPIEIDDRKVVKGDLELSSTNTVVYDRFFDAVLVPDGVAATLVTTELDAVIVLATALTAADYTEGSWTVFAAVLASAESVAANPTTQKQINEATATLKAAFFDLELDQGL